MTEATVTLSGPGMEPITMTEDQFFRATSKMGHNSGLDPVERATGTMFAKDQLRSIIERVEHLEEEKREIAEQTKEVYAEAKGNGFDVKALRTIIRLRKQDPNERQEAETILETYMQALGML